MNKHTKVQDLAAETRDLLSRCGVDKAVYSAKKGITVRTPIDGVLFDDDLRIAGNVIWNGPADHPLGLGGEEFGCADDHPTCAAALVLASNTINVRQPSLRAPGRRNWRIASASRAFLPAAVAIPSFPDEQPSLAIPGPATRSNTVTRDRAGAVRRAGSDVGAYAS